MHRHPGLSDIEEVIDSCRSGRLKEMFATGTAAVISPVGEIGYKGSDYKIADGGVGYSCLAEIRMIETIEHGKPQTSFMRFGDRIRIEIEDNKLEPPRAVIMSAQRRLRPILLTTATTVAGLLPLALSPSTLWPPLAWATTWPPAARARSTSSAPAAPRSGPLPAASSGASSSSTVPAGS